MRAVGEHLSETHDVDLMGILDRAEAVRDDEARPVLPQLIDGLLDEFFTLGVHGAGGLVEEKDGRVFEEGPGDGNTLLLSATKAAAALADGGLEPAIEPLDKIGGTGVAETFPEFCIGGVGFADEEIFANGLVEEVALLRDVADGVAECGLVQLADGHSVEIDLTLMRIIEAGEKLEESALARAGRSDNGNGLIRRHEEVDVTEDGAAVIVAEAHVFEADLAFDGVWRFAAFEVFGICHVDNFEDTPPGDQSADEAGTQAMHPADRFVEHGDEHEKLRELADRDFLHDAPVGTASHEQNEADVTEESHARAIDGPGPLETCLMPPILGTETVKIALLLGFERVAFDLADAGNVVM